MEKLIRTVREALPILDKYLVVWDVLGDISNTESRGASFFFQEKYTVRRCAQFSIECLAVTTVLFVILRWLATWLQQEQTVNFIDQMAPILQQGPLVVEMYLLGYFVVALLGGTLLDHFLAFVTRKKSRDRVVLTRFLVMYPGIFLQICLTSLAVMMICNWASSQTGISMSNLSPSEIGWLGFFLGFFLIGVFAFSASCLIGAFIGWPLLLLRITRINYGRGGVVVLLLIPGFFIVFPYASYEFWVRTCVPKEQADVLLGAECSIQRYKRGLEEIN